MRGDFEFVPSMSDVLRDQYDKIKKFTDQQFEIFDSHSTRKRILVNGGPGTGKTIIAIEMAKRYAHQKKRVLFTCYTKNLGDWIRSNFSPNELQFISIGNIHSISRSILNRNSIPKEEFLEKVPYLLLEYLENKKLKPFEALILDEAQDLMRPEYLDILSVLLKNGLKNGRWILFGDFISQALFTDKDDEQMYHLINLRIDEELHICSLKRNIRNTKDTALAAITLSAPEKNHTL